MELYQSFCTSRMDSNTKSIDAFTLAVHGARETFPFFILPLVRVLLISWSIDAMCAQREKTHVCTYVYSDSKQCSCIWCRCLLLISSYNNNDNMQPEYRSDLSNIFLFFISTEMIIPITYSPPPPTYIYINIYFATS